MRDRLLHDALHSLTDEAARMLEGRLAAGAEIPFEVGDSNAGNPASGGASRNSTTLYAYRPLTSEFVAAHAEQLRSLDSFEHAAGNLARTRGSVAYLRARGEPVLEVSEVTHARLAVLTFLSCVWEGAESFEEFDRRFDRAYGELESVVLAARLVTTVYVPVHGAVIETPEVNLGDGVQLMSPDNVDADCSARFTDEPRAADCYCVISIDAPSDAALPLAEVRHEARAALTALRLFKPGSVSFGLIAQAEVTGSWRAVAMPFSGRARDEAWRLLAGEDEELRQFMAAVRRIERRTRTAWALRRFEMGLERTVPAEGLTDFLAAMAALLEAHDDRGRAALPARVAALCAGEDDRERVAVMIATAFALERLAIHGTAGKEDRKRLAATPPLATIAEVERHVRALLHDLVCGYLASDLRKLADEILMADGSPLPVDDAIDSDAGFYQPAADLGAIDNDEPAVPTREFDGVFDDTAEITAIDARDDSPDADAGADAPTSAFDAGRPGGPADAWTAKVTSSDSEWWSPDTSSALEAVDPTTENAIPAPTDPATEAFDQTAQTYSEIDADARMHQLAEELVDGYDRALVDSMDDEDDAPAAPPPRDVDADGRMSFTQPGEADLTFDFQVVERDDAEGPPGDARAYSTRPAAVDNGPRTSDDRTDFMHESAGGVGDFPVPEFKVPDRVRHERLRELLGDRAPDEAFSQIMQRSFTHEHDAVDPPAPAPSNDAAADRGSVFGFKRPRLVALRGGAAKAAPVPTDEAPPPSVDVTEPGGMSQVTPAAPVVEPPPSVVDQPTPVVDPQEHVVNQPSTVAEQQVPAVEATTTVESPSQVRESTDVDHDAARRRQVGPETAEFSHLVDPDLDDPDDFAGAV